VQAERGAVAQLVRREWRRLGLANVKLDGKYGLIRIDGTWALDPAFDAAQSLQDNLALVKVGEHASLVDIATGALITAT